MHVIIGTAGGSNTHGQLSSLSVRHEAARELMQEVEHRLFADRPFLDIATCALF